MQRREIIRSLLFTGLGVSLRVPVSALWKLSSPKQLVDEEFAAVTEAIIPTTDTPGAIEAGVPQFILNAIANTDDPVYEDKFMAGWESFKTQCLVRHRAAFHVLSPDQQKAFLESLASAGDKFFSIVRNWTVIGYFTSEVGMTQALVYNALPGQCLPCVEVTDDTRGEATYF